MGKGEVISKARGSFYTYLIKQAFYARYGGAFFMERFEKRLHDALMSDKNFPRAVQEKKYYFLTGILRCAKRNLDKGWIKKKVTERIFETFVKQGFTEKQKYADVRKTFEKRYGVYPPAFIVLSPTQKCNLACVGCYASSKIKSPGLDYKTIDKIVDEAYNVWGNRFMTISGGEPLMYSHDGKTLFHIWKKYPEMFFMFYTNSTLINKKVAGQMAELGNVTPAISIEGMEKETDERRGKGIFKKIIQAIDNLKEAGVAFGVSVTATAGNIDLLLDEKFYDFVFKELGATYMWMFQLMPIGQARNMKTLMINPEQRVKLYRMWEKILKEKRYAIADFWNSGVLSDGCIAYGRKHGYLYIDWNGNIMPCVFIPYYENNVIKLHKQGKKLAEALNSEFFKNGREWQEKYGLCNTKKPHNWLMPCSIRDHWKNFRKNILTKKCKPEDIFAGEALNSKEYTKNLEEFDRELEKLTKPIWKKEYLKKR